MKVRVSEVMQTSGVGFGTSGARGLSDQMTDYVCYVYTRGFLQYLESGTGLQKGSDVVVAGDFRPSTDRIMAAVGRAIVEMGYGIVNGGKVPSPTVALFGLRHGIPAIMVTGSHIPADRNGIKFNTAAGEILKQDEAGIKDQVVVIADGMFDASGSFADGCTALPAVASRVRDQYVDRYLQFFSSSALSGKRIGIYQHSAVGRDMLVDIFRGLGAEVTPLGWSDTFVPVDTEAIRDEDVAMARHWAAEHGFDAIVSTDGDSDRPLIADETGQWLRGDVAGILCASYLGADSVSTPVSCNTALEKSGLVAEVRRTRIGSPYVIASMLEAIEAGRKAVVGYEANGGFLTATDIVKAGRTLAALPTRDAVILLLAIILLADEKGKSISETVAELPARYTASGRLKEFPTAESRAILERFCSGDEGADRKAAEAVFGQAFGPVASLDRTDGVRITFESQEVVHLRPSGNAPEFRCYNEAASQGRVAEMNRICMAILGELRG